MAARHAVAFVATAKAFDVRTDLFDYAGEIHCQDRRQWMAGMSGGAYTELDVERIDATGMDSDQQLPCVRTGRGTSAKRNAASWLSRTKAFIVELLVSIGSPRQSAGGR
jgi:hypothetical protein